MTPQVVHPPALPDYNMLRYNYGLNGGVVIENIDLEREVMLWDTFTFTSFTSLFLYLIIM